MLNIPSSPVEKVLSLWKFMKKQLCILRGPAKANIILLLMYNFEIKGI